MELADLYLRLSVDHPGATSIDRQDAECRRWCAANGLGVRQVYVDRGVSGFSESAQRRGFDAAVAAVRAGEVNTLVVWKLDRLSRRGIGQVGQVLDQFESSAARLVSVMDQLDTSHPQARMILALLSEFARAESHTMGVRITSAKQAQRAAGLWLSGKPPYGYEIADDRRLRPVEPAASIMREVFDMLASGHTLTTVCGRLNDTGHRNSRGHLWSTSALSEAIKTPAYAGFTPVRHVNERGGHASGHPAVYRDPETGLEVSCLARGAKPIVPRAQQLAVFEVLRTRQQRYGRGSAPRRPANALLLRGLGRCAACGLPLVTCNGYRCPRLDRFGAVACEQPACAGVATVDRRVAAAWLALVANISPETVELRSAVAERWTPRPRRLSGWARLTQELGDVRARLDDADAARYVRGDLDDRRHRLVVGKLTTRIARLEAQLAETRHEIDSSALDDADGVARRWERESYDGRRALLRLAWSRILIVKASIRGGHFDERRIVYQPADPAALPSSALTTGYVAQS